MAKSTGKNRSLQTKADAAIATLAADDQDFLECLIDQHTNASDIHRWLAEKTSPPPSYGSVLAYLHRCRREGESARLVNELLGDYQGINPTQAHAAALCHVVYLTHEVMQEIREKGVREIGTEKLDKITALLREQRQSAQAFHQQQRLQDRKELELAGGYRVVEIATGIAEGTPHAGAIADTLKGSIAQLEQEVG